MVLTTARRPAILVDQHADQTVQVLLTYPQP